MILLTPQLTAALARNFALGCIERDDDEPRHDPLPLVKFFNPRSAATWIATEIAEDGDALFGLADLGFGCPNSAISASRKSRPSACLLASASSAISAFRPSTRSPNGRDRAPSRLNHLGRARAAPHLTAEIPSSKTDYAGGRLPLKSRPTGCDRWADPFW